MPTLTPTPAYPIPNRSTKIVFTLNESGANFVRAWITVAPEGSRYDEELRKERVKRVLVYEDTGGEGAPFTFIPDAGGKYTLVAQEYQKGNSFGPAYEDDPSAAPGEVKLGGETTLTLYVGQRLTQQLGTGADTATLVVYVWGDTIRKTTIELHGEDSPSIDPESPSSPKALTAARSTAVLSALDNLGDITAADAIGTLSALVSNFHTRWNFHVASNTFHESPDGDNDLPDGLSTAGEPGQIQEFINRALQAMRQHFTNDDGTGVIDAGDYHNVGSVQVNDWVNYPLVHSVSNLQEAFAGFADLHRCYEGHRANTDVHDSADTTALTPLPPLLALHEAFLTVLAASSPTPPDDQSEGAVLLIQQAGFQEA